MKKSIATLTIIIGISSCGTYQLSEKDAVELAEKYVLENGYTESSTSDSVQVDYPRIHLLKPKAVFHKKGLRKWTVGFQNAHDTSRFKIVWIYRNGKKIKMVHQDLKTATE